MATGQPKLFRASGDPAAAACWEWFEVLGGWPDVTARGSWLKVENLGTVREAPNGLRLRGDGRHDFLDPAGVLLVGGALVTRETRRGKNGAPARLSVPLSDELVVHRRLSRTLRARLPPHSRTPAQRTRVHAWGAVPPQVPGQLAFSEHKMPAAATECQWQ